MTWVSQRVAGAVVAAAVATGATPPVLAQNQQQGNVATQQRAAASNIRQWDSPTPEMLNGLKNAARTFDGSRAQFDVITKDLPRNAIENFRATDARETNQQKIAAEQAAGLIFNVKDKSLFTLLNKSIQDKAAGKPSDPQKQVQDYLQQKQDSTGKFLDLKIKAAENNPGKNPTSVEIKQAAEQMRDSHDQKAWAQTTSGWSASGLKELKSSTASLLSREGQNAQQTASQIAKIDNPAILKTLSAAAPSTGPQDKGESVQAIRQNLDTFARGREKDVNAWSQQVQKQQAEAQIAQAAQPSRAQDSRGTPGPIQSAAPPSLPSTQDRMAGALRDSNQAAGRVPADIRGPKLSSVDCAAAMNSAAQGGTTALAGNRLSVSPADINQTAKDLLDKSKPQPDLSNWNADSLKSLSRNVGQEFKNQMMSAQLAVDGIRAGGNPQVLTENIANPQIRTLIVTQSKPGMSDQELTKLRTDVMGATGFADTNMAVARQLGVTSQAEATERRVPGPQALCAPGS